MSTWIDFKAVKDAARFEPILLRYGIELQPRGKELVGKCPFHEETKASFSVNPEKRVFHCFGCGAKGNLLDFVARKEGVAIRRAAELAAEWLGLDGVSSAPPKDRARRKRAKSEATTPEPNADVATPNAVEPETESNKPLGFALKLESGHPYLLRRGVSSEIAQFFGLGFCARGMLKGRIAVPIHDVDGQLVGYVGRWADETVPDGEERYKLPPGFHKNLVLFNLHRVRDAEHVVIVEGCWSVFRLHALGISAVALLGRTLSSIQEDLLASSSAKRLTLLLDGDRPGREASAELLPRLARRFFVRVAPLPDGAEPDTISEDELVKLVS